MSKLSTLTEFEWIHLPCKRMGWGPATLAELQSLARIRADALQRYGSDALGSARIDGALHRRRVRSNRLRATTCVWAGARAAHLSAIFVSRE